jgi:hypothetical protein
LIDLSLLAGNDLTAKFLYFRILDWRPLTHENSCVYRKSDSAILVMKTAKDRSRCDDAEALNRARERGIFVQRAMNS